MKNFFRRLIFAPIAFLSIRVKIQPIVMAELFTIMRIIKMCMSEYSVNAELCALPAYLTVSILPAPLYNIDAYNVYACALSFSGFDSDYIGELSAADGGQKEAYYDKRYITMNIQS